VAVVIGDPDAQSTTALADRARRVLGPDDGVVVVAPAAGAPTGIDPLWLEGRQPVDGRPTAYVCRGVTCSLPVTDPAALEPLAAVTPEQSA
jgi:uncharacterized protein YyaL (SSP411 family)